MSFAALHASIVSKIVTCVPGLQVCASYPDLRGRIALPAVVVELSGMRPSSQGGHEFGVTAAFTAFCIYDPNQPGAYIGVRDLAASVAVVVHQAGSFGHEVSSARVTALREDSPSPDLDGYFVWAVEWEHDMSLGEPIPCGADIGSYELHVQDYRLGADAPVATDSVTLEGNP